MSNNIFYKCKDCNKNYSTYKSLWYHNNKYHKKTISECNSSLTNNNIKLLEDIDDKKFGCSYCSKKYKYRQGKSRHEQKCKLTSDTTRIKQLESTIETLVDKINNIEKNVKTSNNVFSGDNQTIVKGNINNNFIIPLDSQNLTELLNAKDKMAILNAGRNAHIKLIDTIYQKPEYKNLRNLYITNLSNDLGYIYDEKQKRFIINTKEIIINKYGDRKFYDIKDLYEELEDKISEKLMARLKKLFNDYFDDEKCRSNINKEILLTLYNNRIYVEKIYKEINEFTIGIDV